MAKRATVTGGATAAANFSDAAGGPAKNAGVRTTLADLPAKQQAEVKALAGPINGIANSLNVVREKSKDIAPRVMRLFNAIKNDNERFSFVEFARFWNPKMVTHADAKNGVPGYKQDKTYYALDYMRRQVAQKPRGASTTRDRAVDGLARAIATILQVVQGHEKIVWQAIQQEFRMTENLVGRLQKRVADTEPLFKLNVPPKAHVKVGNIIHIEPAAPAAEGEGEAAAGQGEGQEMAQPGRRVRAQA